MNKGETFITCDLSNANLDLGDDNQILDYGCTFATEGSFSYQEVDTGLITFSNAGDSFNRRPLKSTIIKSLEDNSKWCYALHFSGLFTSEPQNNQYWGLGDNPKVITGEQFKILSGEILQLNAEDNDIYIVNPLCHSEENTLSYKTSNQEEFKDLKFGKFLKIKRGESFLIKSTVDTFIPKISLDVI